MRIDTVTRLERFIVDALLTSPQIPLGVNVVRLAGAQEVEGIANMARTIVVRYVGSDVNVTNKMPLTTERRMQFQLDLAAQEYLTESGHDYVVQMCAGVYNTLTNQTPTNTGVEITEPLTMQAESFQGLTDNSQYVYTQNWFIMTQQVERITAIDPCVQRGNCSYLFPSNTINSPQPGEVTFGNAIYSPVLLIQGEPKFEFCGVEPGGPGDKDLVYAFNKDEIFLEDYENYRFVSSDTFDTTGKFLIVYVYALDDPSKPFKSVFYSNCGGRRFIQIAGAQPAYAGANFIAGLYRSPIGNVGNPTESGGPEVLIPPTFAFKNGYGTVLTNRATVYTNPSDPNATKGTVKYGSVYPTQAGAVLKVDGVDYVLIGNTPLGKVWIRDDQFTQFTPPPIVDCTIEGITEGVPIGTDPIDSGPIEECE